MWCSRTTHLEGTFGFVSSWCRTCWRAWRRQEWSVDHHLSPSYSKQGYGKTGWFDWLVVYWSIVVSSPDKWRSCPPHATHPQQSHQYSPCCPLASGLIPHRISLCVWNPRCRWHKVCYGCHPVGFPCHCSSRYRVQFDGWDRVQGLYFVMIVYVTYRGTSWGDYLEGGTTWRAGCRRF